MPNAEFHILSSIAGLIGFGAVVLGMGRTLLTASGVPFQSPGEKAVFSAATGFGVMSYAVFTLGVFDGLYAVSIWVLIGVAAAVAAAGSICFPFSCRRSVSLKNSRPPIAHLPTALLAFSIVAGFCLTLTPAVGNDTLSYHLTVPKLFLQRHGFYFIPGNIFSHYPLGTEMLYVIGLIMGGDVTAKGIHTGFALLTLLAMWQLMKHKLPQVNTIALALLIFYTIPSVFMTAHMAYSDLTYTLFTFLSVYAFLNWFTGRDPKWIALCGVLSGLGMATKYAGLLLPFMGVLGILLVCRSRKTENRRAIGLIACYLTFAVIVGCPFYIRNWIVTGNPFYPFFYKLFGGIGWDMVQSRRYDLFHRTLGMGRELLDYLMLPWNLSFHAKINSPQFDGLLGPVFILILPFGIWIRGVKPVVKIIAAYCAITFVFWSVSVQQIRYLIPIFPFLAIMSVYIINHYAGTRSITLILVICMAAGTGINGYRIANHFRKIGPIPVITGQESKEMFYRRHIPAYGMFHYINTHLPENSKTMLIYMKNHGYLCERPFYSDSIFESYTIEKILTMADNPETVLNSLKKRGFTHILYDVHYMLGKHSTLSPRNEKLFADFQKHYLQPMKIDQNRFYLFHMKTKKMSSPKTTIGHQP